MTDTTVPANAVDTFRADNAFRARMAEGHYIRTGHELAGYYVPSPDVSGVVVLVRTCCEQASA